MQVSFNESRWTEFQNYFEIPKNKTTLIATTILGSALFTGYWILPVSKFWGEVVLIAGASAGWGVFFSSR